MESSHRGWGKHVNLFEYKRAQSFDQLMGDDVGWLYSCGRARPGNSQVDVAVKQVNGTIRSIIKNPNKIRF